MQTCEGFIWTNMLFHTSVFLRRSYFIKMQNLSAHYGWSVAEWTTHGHGVFCRSFSHAPFIAETHWAELLGNLSLYNTCRCTRVLLAGIDAHEKINRTTKPTFFVHKSVPESSRYSSQILEVSWCNIKQTLPKLLTNHTESSHMGGWQERVEDPTKWWQNDAIFPMKKQQSDYSLAGALVWIKTTSSCV